MKTRTTARWKAKKRRGCWANKFKMAASKQTPLLTPGPSTFNNTEIDDVNSMKHIFHEINNRSSEKLAANSIFSSQNVTQTQEEPLMTRNKKRKLDQATGLLGKTNNQIASGYSLIKLSNLNKLLNSAATCNNCKKGNLELHENIRKRNGLSQALYTKCGNCLHTVYMETSSRERLKAYDVNIKSAHAAVQGMGYAGLKKVYLS